MRKRSLLFVMIALAFILSGCMQINGNYRIFSDQTYQSETEILIPMTIINDESYHFENYKDDLIAVFSKADSVVTQKEVTIDDTRYQAITIENKRAASQNEQITITREDDEILFVHDLQIESDYLIEFDAFGLGDDYKQILEAYGFSIIERIQMPGDILSANSGTINGDILTVDIIEDDVTKIIVRSGIYSGISALIVIFLITIVLLASLITIYISYNHKRKKKTHTPDAPLMKVETIEKITQEKKKNDILDTLALEEKEDHRDFPY